MLISLGLVGALFAAFLLGKSSVDNSAGFESVFPSGIRNNVKSVGIGKTKASPNTQSDAPAVREENDVDATLLSEQNLQEWQTKALEQDPKLWASNLIKLTERCKSLTAGARFRIVIEFLTLSVETRSPDQFWECTKEAFRKPKLLESLVWDLEGTTLDEELGKRVVWAFSKKGNGDRLYLSLADRPTLGSDSAAAVATLAAMCDLMHDGAQWSPTEIRDQYVKSEVQKTLFSRWLTTDRLRSAQAFLDSSWSVADEGEAARSLFDASWFLNNSNAVSTLIRDALPSPRRRLLIEKMVAHLRDTDLVAAKAWEEELK